MVISIVTVKSRLMVVVHFFQHLILRYKADGCGESAAALTYMSLFAVVPLLTLIYAMFSIIPSFQGLGEDVERLLFENLMPHSSQEVAQYLHDFSLQARNLSAVGGFFLLITSYLMLTNIEKTFNRMWAAVGARRGLASFLVYWGVMSFGPLLIGAGIMMHTYLLSFKLIVDEVDALGVTAVFLEYLPWFMTWAGCTLLFVAMPNCRVVFRYAVIGGLVTTVLFELAKGLFGFFVSHASYNTVYGAFAVVPLFLLWIYLCWMIILGGAELVRSLETFSLASYQRRLPDLVATLLICFECLSRQNRGTTVSDRDMIELGLNQEQWRTLRTMLLSNRLLVSTDEETYVLARDPASLTVWELNAMLGGGFTDMVDMSARKLVADYPWYDRLESMFNEASGNARNLFSITVQELFSEQSKPS